MVHVKFFSEVFLLNYLQQIDWMSIMDTLIIVAIILTVSLIIGVVLNRMLTKKLDAKVEATDSELMGIFLRAMKGLPIPLCFVSGLYWCVQAWEDMPVGLDKIFS